jgi:hypothetical protein
MIGYCNQNTFNLINEAEKQSRLLTETGNVPRLSYMNKTLLN